jgi:hypothetical protein
VVAASACHSVALSAVLADAAKEPAPSDAHDRGWNHGSVLHRPSGPSAHDSLHQPVRGK